MMCVAFLSGLHNGGEGVRVVKETRHHRGASVAIAPPIYRGRLAEEGAAGSRSALEEVEADSRTYTEVESLTPTRKMVLSMDVFSSQSHTSPAQEAPELYRYVEVMVEES